MSLPLTFFLSPTVLLAVGIPDYTEGTLESGLTKSPNGTIPFNNILAPRGLHSFLLDLYHRKKTDSVRFPFPHLGKKRGRWTGKRRCFLAACVGCHCYPFFCSRTYFVALFVIGRNLNYSLRSFLDRVLRRRKRIEKNGERSHDLNTRK